MATPSPQTRSSKTAPVTSATVTIGLDPNDSTKCTLSSDQFGSYNGEDALYMKFDGPGENDSITFSLESGLVSDWAIKSVEFTKAVQTDPAPPLNNYVWGNGQMQTSVTITEHNGTTREVAYNFCVTIMMQSNIATTRSSDPKIVNEPSGSGGGN